MAHIPAHLNGRDAGASETTEEFRAHYGFHTPFDFTNMGDCLNYLVNTRQYQYIVGQFDRVNYTNGNPSISAFLAMGKRHGQVQTFPDLNQGSIVKSVIAGGRTYRFYNQAPNALSIGLALQGRLESVSVDKLSINDLHECYLSYADAALLEFYRESNQKPSLAGYCKYMAEKEDLVKITQALNLASEEGEEV